MITLNDIAKKAGVSKSAVSFALRNKGRLEEKTRRRVIAIANELGYRPNMLITGVQSGRTKTIGVILNLSSSSSPGFWSQIASGIGDSLLDYDNVPLFLHQKEGFSTEDLLYKLIDRRVDGLIFKPRSKTDVYENLDELLKRGLPAVVIDSEVQRHPELDFAGVDNFSGGKKAAEYLIEHNHCKLGFLGDKMIKTSEDRRSGFEHVIARSMNCSVTSREVDKENAKEAACSILSMPDRPTAIFCYNDHFAYQLYLAANEMGLSIPEDISILGFGNLEFSKYLHVGLTTFDQNPKKTGDIAVELLMNRIKNKAKETKKVLIEPKLIERSSVCNINK